MADRDRDRGNSSFKYLLTTRVDIELLLCGTGRARRAGVTRGGRRIPEPTHTAFEPYEISYEGIIMATHPTAPVAATWITIAQAADLMSCSTKTVRRLIARGALPARRIGSRMIRIDAADLDALGHNLTVAHA